MPFMKWPSIEGTHNIIKSLRLANSRAGIPLPTVTYRGKIKLHGTNAGVRHEGGRIQAQSRKQDITPSRDNAGFAAWVAQESGWFAAAFDILKAATGSDDICIFGEWCGRSIMKGASITQIDRRVFAIFGIQCGDTLYYHPDIIGEWLTAMPDDIYILPWATEPITLDYSDRADLKEKVDQINAKVEEVEACDPWVKATFGVEGTGEGLVYYPLGYGKRDEVSDLMFKAKGVKHRVKASKKAATVDPEVLGNIRQFVDYFLPEPRLEQGVAEACGGTIDPKQTGNFLRWIQGDVKKESVVELDESGLTWKQVSKPLMTRAREWYMGKCKEI